MSSKSEKIPPRIDLEPLYKALKNVITDQWTTYTSAVAEFVMGKINQDELSNIIDPIILSSTGETEHLHNELIAAIYANTTREVPDHGVATWVSANDKPLSGSGTKVISGDAAEQRRKAEVMALPNRDRRRIKDLTTNDIDHNELFAQMFSTTRRLPKPKMDFVTVPQSAGGITKTNWDMEIRKRYAQPLACESGEFPDSSTIEARMTPMCYEMGLVSGHSSDAAQFMAVATETFVKQFLSSVFDKTRSNGPGSSGSAGSGGAASWITTHKYKRQLEIEEEAFARKEITRDKAGLLPVETKAAAERGPLGMADLRTALELGDCGIGQMPFVIDQVMNTYREGELEIYNNEFSAIPGHSLPTPAATPDAAMSGMGAPVPQANGGDTVMADADEDIDMSEYGWQGATTADRAELNDILDGILV